MQNISRHRLDISLPSGKSEDDVEAAQHALETLDLPGIVRQALDAKFAELPALASAKVTVTN